MARRNLPERVAGDQPSTPLPRAHVPISMEEIREEIADRLDNARDFFLKRGLRAGLFWYLGPHSLYLTKVVHAGAAPPAKRTATSVSNPCSR
ncbi:hypothetical protein [Archangium sp.]|uniref:hypothetical protein n=1 Tax=Archangium sp. TaxID=1872627 RepID=UPI002D24D842|nr:hypothetical protein [Archangium sp.]HYO59571.1 hypothetical protein [Archangium sp.]